MIPSLGRDASLTHDHHRAGGRSHDLQPFLDVPRQQLSESVKQLLMGTSRFAFAPPPTFWGQRAKTGVQRARIRFLNQSLYLLKRAMVYPFGAASAQHVWASLRAEGGAFGPKSAPLAVLHVTCR